jgi:hypothetical protein
MSIHPLDAKERISIASRTDLKKQRNLSSDRLFDDRSNHFFELLACLASSLLTATHHQLVA